MTSHGKRKKDTPPKQGAKSQPQHGGKKNAASGSPARSGGGLGVRKLGTGDYELVHPRCARDRAEDLQEVRKMLDAGEVDVALDECRWLLSGCSDCLEAHRILGEIAVGEDDLPLARGHFGYAYRLGAQALQGAKIKGPLPYQLPSNQSFFKSGKGLAWCLMKLGKREMAVEVAGMLLACDPSDPLAINKLLAETTSPAGE